MNRSGRVETKRSKYLLHPSSWFLSEIHQHTPEEKNGCIAFRSDSLPSSNLSVIQFPSLSFSDPSPNQFTIPFLPSLCLLHSLRQLSGSSISQHWEPNKDEKAVNVARRADRNRQESC